jgi:hypothetical protein
LKFNAAGGPLDPVRLVDDDIGQGATVDFVYTNGDVAGITGLDTGGIT